MAPTIADLQRQITKLKREKAVGWRQFFRLKETVNEILQRTRIDSPQLVPIIRRMILNLETNHRKCSICMDVISTGGICFLYGCGHTFHDGCFMTWLRQGNNCPECRGDSEYIVV
jgi:hypothetical protein